ncbi:T-box transcription factor tbx4 [Mortierella alpina]|nr:T-box transcription factor tbx4 [Mortierella alpina]
MAVALAKESYTHPDKYQIGAHWMKGTIFFDKTKLSNSRESAAKSSRKASSSKSAVGNSHHIFHMSSFHKYRPRVHLVQHAAHSDTVASSTTYTFHQTTFIAVTHYQNSKVNDLKKGFNPHARGFRSSAGMSLSFPVATEQKPSCSALQSKRTPTLKRHYCERDTSESDADAYADVNAEPTETDQSSDDDDDDDDFDSDVSALPGMARTSSSEASAKSSKSLCRVNKDNCAMVSISISKGMIEAKRVVGKSSLRQQSKRLQRKTPTNLCDSHPSRTRASHAHLHLKSIHATSAHSTPDANKANRKQRIYNTRRRFDTSSSSAQSSSSASTKCSSICSITSNLGRTQGQAPQKIEPQCDIQEKFAQLSASHSVPSHMEQYQHDTQHGPVVSPLHHDPPTAPPLSWYQQLVYSDQPSQLPSHQTIQRPVLSTTAQNSEEPEPCLMHPFTMDKNLDYGMLPGPQQAVPSQALSEVFVDTDASVVQDTRALDTSEVNTPLEARTEIVKTGARHAHSQVHVQVEEGSTSSQIHSHLTTTFTTILESRTVMSTTSAMAILPSADSSISAHLEHVLRENLRLKAFIRARYGK